ncbi:Arginase/deacetylase [Eremomyces bilateralis CBS 781.70]|uniref:Arginase/deacetylase n=1 Tax=Eremomyces bilateralis CBS 781.70 TaxID=1392243 RepID=A0A6G1G5C0_9PEZI|nr:Arginase/deacetylase [Eremomyces bilateralis CBS 781.70]KAF1813254.1 Arginase/deacetylase [Eremomyces bilateralis CBS 781.70]
MEPRPPDQDVRQFNEPRHQQPPETISDSSARLVDSLNQLSINCDGQPTSPASAFQPRSPRRDQNGASRSPSTTRMPPSPLRRMSSNLTSDRSRNQELSRRASSSSLRAHDPSLTPRKSLSRRSSINPLPSPTMDRRFPLPPMEEATPLTAASVAAGHFQRELALHGEGQEGKTVVILHDDCYGHRFSRPKTSKASLSMIVERPERIHAGILGITTAYVRLGERHAGGLHAPHPARSPSSNLPFRIHKTARALPLNSPSVVAVHGAKWMDELKTMCGDAGQKLVSTGKELSRTASLPGQPTKEKFHEGDLYLCSESLNAFQGALGGVCDGIDAVFASTKGGKGASNAFVCVRPPGHHCSADYPSGFCWLNNVHVGIQYAAQTHGLTHAAIIDFDLHHGDGSQAVTWNHNAKTLRLPKNTPNAKKNTIGYFSLHDINSYPCEYGDQEKVQNASLCIENAHNQNIWNVHLQPWKTERDFWDLYESRYLVLIEKARAFLRAHTTKLNTEKNQPKPLGAIFLSAGFDASEWESEGMQRHKVNVPTEFYARFTRDVVQMSKEEGLGVDGRVISVLEGGYSDRALTSGVLSHLSGLCDNDTPIFKQEETENGLGFEMGRRMGMLNMSDGHELPTPAPVPVYDSAWWHPSALTTLETLVYPAPPAPSKKPKSGPHPTYQTPTQSFTAKVIDPERVRRSASSTYRPMSASPSRPPSPPPPEVDWATAAHELCKLLVPTDRQTKSCQPEELAEVRVKKERHSTTSLPADTAPPTRQLRERRTRAPKYVEPLSDDETASVRSVSRTDRRKTMGDFPLPTDEVPAPAATRSSRRLSTASTMSSTSTVAPSVASTATRPVKPPPANLQVKKTRVASGTKPDATKSRNPSAPPVPRVPSGYAPSTKSATQAASQNKSTTASSTDADVDALTTGVQRIRIKMPTPEEYAVREQQKVKEAAEKKRTTTKPAPRKPAAPRTTKVGPVTKRGAATKEAKPAAVGNTSAGVPRPAIPESQVPPVPTPIAAPAQASALHPPAVAQLVKQFNPGPAESVPPHVGSAELSAQSVISRSNGAQVARASHITPPAAQPSPPASIYPSSLIPETHAGSPPASVHNGQPAVATIPEQRPGTSPPAFEFHNSFPPSSTPTNSVTSPKGDDAGSPRGGPPRFPMGLQWQPVNGDIGAAKSRDSEGKGSE